MAAVARTVSRANGTTCERAAGMNSPLRSTKPTSANCQVPGLGSLKKQLPAQARQGVILNAVGVEAVELEIGDVVEAQNQTAVVPGVAARPRRVSSTHSWQDAASGRSPGRGEPSARPTWLRPGRRRRPAGCSPISQATGAGSPCRAGRPGPSGGAAGGRRVRRLPVRTRAGRG